MRTSSLGLIACAWLQAQSAVYFDDSAAGVIRLGNAFYEIALSKANGAVTALIDKAAGASLTKGSRNGCLWGANFGRSGAALDYVGGCSFGAASQNRFSYRWDAAAGRLTLSYGFHAAAARRANATVTVSITPDPWWDMQAAVENQWDSALREVLFPSDLLFADDAVQAAYLPYQFPGVRLRPEFFRANRSRVDIYPSLYAFADYLALEVAGGRLAFYSINPSGPVQPVAAGFTDDERVNPGSFYIVHRYQAAVEPGGSFTTPVVRVRIGQTVRESILGYRQDNGIAAYPSVAAKLGGRFDALARAPLVKMDLPQFVRKPFREAIADLESLSPPVLLHPVAFQPGGFDSAYPDFLPPEPRWGATEDFRAFVEAARARGHLVMPYTNPTWWNPESPTLANLPAGVTVADIAVTDERGQAVWNAYGDKRGIVVTPWHPFVAERLAGLMGQFRDEAPVDYLFQDQIGARAWQRDYNPAAPHKLAYSGGWLNHWTAYAAQGLMTEDGWDRLAAAGIGFCGSLLTGTTRFEPSERYGAGSNGNRNLGAGNWDPYPLAPFLMHDKVFFYHHDLEQYLTSERLEVITWNMAFGNMMYYVWPASPVVTPRPERVRFADLLQRTVAPRFAGVAMSDFSYVTEDVTRSSFDGLQVLANWHPTEPYGDIAAGGFHAVAGDRTVEAAVYHGGHYVVIERSAEMVTVRQADGPDWDATVELPLEWPEPAEVQVVARGPSGDGVVQSGTAIGRRISFRYRSGADRYEIRQVANALP